jgi:hypothetical protein
MRQSTLGPSPANRDRAASDRVSFTLRRPHRTNHAGVARLVATMAATSVYGDTILPGMAAPRSTGTRLPSNVGGCSSSNPEFRQLFTLAREVIVERWSSELLEIADDPTLDPFDKKVRVDVGKWLMGKLAPPVTAIVSRSPVIPIRLSCSAACRIFQPIRTRNYNASNG